MRTFFLILVVLAVIGAGAVEWANAAWTQPGPPAVSGTETVVLIAPRTPVHAVAQQLQDAHLLNYALAFEFDVRLHGLSGALKAGEYAIPSHASMADIAAILASGKSIQHKFTAAEGLTSGMIYQLVMNDRELVGPAGAEPAEGTLLPETYLFTRGMTRAGLLERMRAAQAKFLEVRWAARTSGLPFTSRTEAVTLASVVEKESAIPEERRHVAAVFINRLRAGIRLQSDPTIIYGLTKGYPLGHGIRESEIASQSPYNTYVITGLPPGPICNPGKQSLAAVLAPAQSSDLYFVANGKGGHVFAATMASHLKNVAAYRAEERARKLQIEMPAVAPPSPPARRKRG